MKYFCRFCNRYLEDKDNVFIHDDVLHPENFVFKHGDREPFAYYLVSPHGIIFKLTKDMTSDLLNLTWNGKLAYKPLYTEVK